jgi:FHA domain-containing protein
VAICPSGHASMSDDFCDVCGVLIGAAPSLAPDRAPGEAALSGPGGTAVPGSAPGSARPAPGELCPRCGAARAGQFCESCGYDFTLAGQDTFGPDAYPAPPPPPGPPPAPPAPVPAPQAPPSAPAWPAPDGEWTAVVTADRAYYDAIQAAGGPDAAGIAFPAYCPQRRFRLAGTEVRIGRHSASSGIDPEIDLSVPPADPGVSRLHAVLLKAPDGTWSVVDPGSANGTAVNGSEIPNGQAVPLREGDRIHLGAWTELRVVRDA